jgi:hypothetical protein
MYIVFGIIIAIIFALLYWRNGKAIFWKYPEKVTLDDANVIIDILTENYQYEDWWRGIRAELNKEVGWFIVIMIDSSFSPALPSEMNGVLIKTEDYGDVYACTEKKGDC